MALSLRRGCVSGVLERHADLIRFEIDGVPCIAYPLLTGPVDEGDDVLVNVQARGLGLGSGGFDVLYANLSQGLELSADAGAHVMALPYAPGQWAVHHAEEGGVPADSLGGLPVVLCTVHSQVVPVCAALVGLRVAYLQVAGGALGLALSDALRALRERGLISATASVAPCFGGDVRCVSVASAALWAATAHDVAVCAVGPGIVGTGTRFGHGAVSLAEAANVVSALRGTPILAERTSDADERERHRGVSHHTRDVLDLALGDVLMAPATGGDSWREACAGLPLSHMGRGPEEDPAHFAAAFAAGRLAAERARGRAG